MYEGPRFAAWVTRVTPASDNDVIAISLIVIAVAALVAGICWLILKVRK